jgi:hypothetical protein
MTGPGQVAQDDRISRVHAIKASSPYQNVRAGTRYPAVMVTPGVSWLSYRPRFSRAPSITRRGSTKTVPAPKFGL